MRINNKRVRVTVDVLMTVALPMQMAYSLIGETYHEIAGTLLFACFLAHHAMRVDWRKGLFRGRYSPYRAFNTAVNLALSVIMFLLPLSGIAMSKHLYTFLPTANLAADARTIHFCLAYWGFLLMCVHLGLHMGMIFRKRPKWLRYPVAFISLYGVYAFLRRDLPEYLFLRSQFAFFDFTEPLPAFFADYLAIIVLFSAVGYWTGERLKNNP